MSTFRVNYVDGHDHRYKSYETATAKAEEDAVSELNDLYDTNYSHKIVEVLKVDAQPGRRMRIGNIPGITPALD